MLTMLLWALAAQTLFWEREIKTEEEALGQFCLRLYFERLRKRSNPPSACLSSGSVPGAGCLGLLTQMECREEAKLLDFNREFFLTLSFTSHVSFILSVNSEGPGRRSGTLLDLKKTFVSFWDRWGRKNLFFPLSIRPQASQTTIQTPTLHSLPSSEERTPMVDSIWKHDWFPSFSDGFIYFDYTPPSECWPYPLLVGNGNEMGNRSSLVTFPLLFREAIISLAVIRERWLAEREPGSRRYRRQTERTEWKFGGTERQMARGTEGGI